MARKRRVEKELRLDLHGMTAFEAEIYLKEQMNYLPNDIDVVRVIHGYHGGQVLLNLVRKEFYHYRIEDILPVFANDGETLYIIKKQ